MFEQATMMLTFAIGHACFAALAINTLHGFGIKDRALEPFVRRALLAVAILTPAAGLWLACHAWESWPAPVRAYAWACLGMALVLLPACTIARALRATPEGITGRSTGLDLAETPGPDVFIGDGRRSWMLRLPGNESLRPRLEEWQVDVPGLPESLAGLSLVQVTDLHFSPCYHPRFFEAVADEVGRLDADLVFFTGDLLDHDDCSAWIAPVFSRMAGKLGRFAILGNHDYRHDGPGALREMGRGGFEDVDGRWARLEIGDSSLAIGGTSCPWGPYAGPSTIPAADYRILLSHTPDMLYRASASGVDLMLSGHNHGGQICLPVVGPVLMPSRYSRRFDRGFFRRDRTLLYVSRGVGGKDPIRYGAPPEITRIVLQPAPTAPNRERHARTGSSRAVASGVH